LDGTKALHCSESIFIRIERFWLCLQRHALTAVCNIFGVLGRISSRVSHRRLRFKENYSWLQIKGPL
jgi:hypothetical protein